MGHNTIVKNRRTREANYRAPSPPRRLMEKCRCLPPRPPAKVRLGNAAVSHSGLEALRKAIPIQGLMKTAAWYADRRWQEELARIEQSEIEQCHIQWRQGATNATPMTVPQGYLVVHLVVPSSVGMTGTTAW